MLVKSFESDYLRGMDEQKITSLERGAQLIKAYVKTLPETPGVYRMIGEGGDILYIGKAKALAKRVVSYTRVDQLPHRLKRMVSQTVQMEFVHTQTEVEALLLEANLIKKLKPKYNILLKDDKSFPYIAVDLEHAFPLVHKHRGKRKKNARYYGPFASAGSVNRTLETLQRIFMIRNCPDTVFKNRTRPCLQYHIKRCTAPCVGYVSKGEYAQQIKQVDDFLKGKSDKIQKDLGEAMERASAAMNYEAAAAYRDRIKALAAVKSYQDINMAALIDADIIVCSQEQGYSCVQVFFFRSGSNLGNYSFFPAQARDETPEDVLQAFLLQFYDNKPVPKVILLSHDLPEQGLVLEALRERAEGGVQLLCPQRGDKKRAVEFALRNAQARMVQRLNEKASHQELLRGVAEAFGLDEPPARIEVYDNSHISGTDMVGAMIVAGEEGFQKGAYRKFNIKQAAASDDYGMMREVMERRFAKLIEEPDTAKAEDIIWPDLLLIDGGQGQFNTVHQVLEEYGVLDRVALVSIAKGPERNAGRETFFMEGCASFTMLENDPVLHYLQRLRDEAHRFAVSSHRVRRQKKIAASPLDDIPGIGAARKKALLQYFGSAKAVAAAAVEDIAQVEGISRDLAEAIYGFFH